MTSLDDATIAFLDRVGDDLSAAISSRDIGPLIALRADALILRDRVQATTAPKSGTSLDRWLRNLFGRLGQVRDRLAATPEIVVDVDEPARGAFLIVDLVKVRQDLLAIVGAVDGMISTYLPDDDAALRRRAPPENGSLPLDPTTPPGL
jgi:hypothetical protein